LNTLKTGKRIHKAIINMNTMFVLSV